MPRLAARGAVAALLLVGLLGVAGSASVGLRWQRDQRNAQVRIDVLGRERMLTMWSLAATMRLAGFGPGKDRDQLATVLELADRSWAALLDGGPELGLDLTPTGRSVVGWSTMHADAALNAEVAAYFGRIRKVNDRTIATSADVRELEAQAVALVGSLSAAGRLAGDESRALAQPELVVALFLVGAAGFIGAAAIVLERQRRRRRRIERAQEATAASELLLSRVLETAHDVLVVRREDASDLWVSPAFERLYGAPVPRTADELRERIHPDDAAAVQALFARFADGDTDRGSVELRLSHGDGHWVPTALIATDRRDDPVIGGLVITLQDLTERHAAAEELAAAAAMHRFFDENSTELMIRATADGRVSYASSACGPMLELHPDDLVGAPLTVLVVREDVERLSALVREAVQLGSVAEADLRLATAAAEQHVWTRTTVQSVVDAHGEAELHVTVRDITEQREAEERLARERQLLGVTLDNVSAGVLALDGYLRVIEANPVLADIIGFRPEIGTLVTDFAHRFQICRPDGTAFDLYERPLARAVGGELVVQLPALIVAEDGSVRHVIANAVPLEDVGQGRGGAVMTIHDVTALRHAEDELRRMALHDTLTGLANRHQLLRHLIDAFQRNARSPEELALLFIDLDGFKAVNDSLGHDAGDALLVAVGERLTSSVRVGDFVARYGGDEFVVVAERLADPVAASTLVSRLEVALAMPFELTQGTARIGGSIGVARMFEVDSPHMLLAQADAEMYERKRWRKRAGAPVS